MSTNQIHHSTFVIIEQRLRCKTDIIRFQKYLENLNAASIETILVDVVKWVNEYSNIVDLDDTYVCNFIGHLQKMDELVHWYCENSGTDNSIRVIDLYWNTIINTYCNMYECREFVDFLNKIVAF